MVKIKLKEVSFHDLKRLVQEFDWVPVAEILKRKTDTRGKKVTFEPVSCFRAFILGAYLEIEDDTELARRIAQQKEYQEFCGISKPMSHDVLTKFRRKYRYCFEKVFEYFDDLLESIGVFENDSLSFDGTDIPVPIKNKISPHSYHFGATSSNNKFHGFWLMIANSVKHQIAREFEVGYGRTGQIELGKRTLSYRRIDDSKNNFYFFLDGIFDCEEIYNLVLQKQGKLPVIGYNKRGSSYDTIEDLPENDWRFYYNPLLHFPSYLFMIHKQRDSSERLNAHAKMYTLISKIANKVRKNHTILKNTVEHIVTFTFILEQLQLLTVFKDKLRQKTLFDFY